MSNFESRQDGYISDNCVFSDLSSNYNECFPTKQFTPDRKRTNNESITSPSSKRMKYNQSTTDKLLPSLLEKCSMDTNSDSFRSKAQSSNPMSPIKSPYEYKSRLSNQATKYNHTPHFLDSILENDDGLGSQNNYKIIALKILVTKK